MLVTLVRAADHFLHNRRQLVGGSQLHRRNGRLRLGVAQITQDRCPSFVRVEIVNMLRQRRGPSLAQFGMVGLGRNKLLQHGQHIGPLDAARQFDYHLLKSSEIILRWAKWLVCLLTISVNGHVIRKVRCWIS